MTHPRVQRSLLQLLGRFRVLPLTSVASTLGGRRGEEGGLPRSLAKAKMEHGPLGPRLGSERVSRLSQWVTLPQPLGHGASANPLLTYEQPIGNCQTAVRMILPKNNETGLLEIITLSALVQVKFVKITMPHIQSLSDRLAPNSLAWRHLWDTLLIAKWGHFSKVGH